MDSLVSVIIPTYNRYRMVTRAIESVLTQTYRNIELIIVDDASKDNTFELLKTEYADPRIKIVRHPRNLGGAAARNSGIRNAKGGLIAFLDSDDEWLPEKLARQIPLLLSNPDVGAVYCKHYILEHGGSLSIDRRIRYYKGWVQNYLLRGWCPTSTSLFVIRKECFQTVGLFDDSLPSFQDYDLWLRIATRYQFDYIDCPLVKYFIHDESRVSIDIDARINGLEKIMAKWEEIYKHAIGEGQFSRLKKGFYEKIYIKAANQCMHRGQTSDGTRYILRAIEYAPYKFQLYVRLVFVLTGLDFLYQKAGRLRRQKRVRIDAL